MSPGEITDRLNATLTQHGFKSTIVSAGHIPELRGPIRDSLEAGLIPDAVYRRHASYFDKMLDQDASWARSIIVVAIPRPVLKVGFVVDGQRRETLIPPTYEHSIDKVVTAAIESELTTRGYRTMWAMLPLKLLAVCSGLARYGRNNIAYVEGMGSILRFNAFYSDLPPVSDTWHEPQVLDECTKCSACINKCPAGAIDPNRFQLRVERCLTYHNESSESFPSRIQESWHHCLIGCMRCQQSCPVNKTIRSRAERFAEFTDTETALLLSGVTKEELPPALIAKFGITDLLDDPVGLARNLRAVLE